jgi:hypothetical protein
MMPALDHAISAHFFPPVNTKASTTSHLVFQVQVTVAADDALTVRVRVPLFEGAVKVPDPVIFKMPSASFSQTWCAEALHTKYGTSTDILLA